MRVSYRGSLYKQRVNTYIGSAFLISWTLACGLLVWQAAFDQNPIANAMAAAMERQINF